MSITKVKGSALTAATTPIAGTEEVIGIQSGNTVRIPVSEFGGGGGLADSDQTISTTGNRDITLGGSTSSDKLRVLQPAGTSGIMEWNGDGTFNLGLASKNNYLGPSTSSYLQSAPLGGRATLANTFLQGCTVNLNLNCNNQLLYTIGSAYIGGTIVGNGSRKISVHKTTSAPTTNITNVTDVYCDDDSSGVAGLVIKPEDGKTITLTRSADAAFSNTVNTGDANTDALINALISALPDKGFIE